MMRKGWLGLGISCVAFALACSSSGGDSAVGSWQPLSTAGAPSPRVSAVVVWANSGMLVWGGSDDSTTDFRDGSVYDPARDQWRPVAEAGAPAPRQDATGVWSGSEVLIWGGFGERVWGDGGRYDPVADSWKPIEAADGVEGRYHHHAAWTGTEMLIWGGFDESMEPVTQGWRFDPAAETWTPMSQDGAPEPSVVQSSAWTGTELLVWTTVIDPVRLVGHGYRPELDEWRELSEGAPILAAAQVAWLDGEMIVWGDTGFGVGGGGLYDPESDSWRVMSRADQPSRRPFFALVGYGDRAVVWAGADILAEEILKDGGIYDRHEDQWARIEAPPTIEARSDPEAVLAGSEVIFWGGWDGTRHLAGGARFVPP